MQNTRTRHGFTVAAVAGATAVLIAAIAVQGIRRAGNHARPVHLILATDVSGGCSPCLPAFASLGSALVAGLDPDGDSVTAYRMERSTRCYYDDRAPESPDDFEETMVHALSPKPSRPGTFSAACWTAVARRAAESAGQQQEIVIESDGDDDQDSARSRRAIRAAAVALARNRSVRAVAVVGVSDENWQALADELAPIGGSRLRLFGGKQISADAVGRFLDDARASVCTSPTGTAKGGAHANG